MRWVRPARRRARPPPTACGSWKRPLRRFSQSLPDPTNKNGRPKAPVEALRLCWFLERVQQTQLEAARVISSRDRPRSSSGLRVQRHVCAIVVAHAADGRVDAGALRHYVLIGDCDGSGFLSGNCVVLALAVQEVQLVPTAEAHYRVDPPSVTVDRRGRAANAVVLRHDVTTIDAPRTVVPVRGDLRLGRVV